MIKKNKEKKQSKTAYIAKIRRENRLFFMVVAVIFLLSLMTVAFTTLLSDMSDVESLVSRGHRKSIKVDRGGCLIDSGYSWCAFRNRCVLSDKESCDKESGDREILERYLVNNLEDLAPIAEYKETKGRISEVNLLSENLAFVGYSDGTDFYNAEVSFTILPDKTVDIESFFIKNKNGNPYELSGCKKDNDCIPSPFECHPHSCVNKDLVSDFTKPEACDQLFDSSAAYKNEDCACDFSTGQCFNKNSIRLE